MFMLSRRREKLRLLMLSAAVASLMASRAGFAPRLGAGPRTLRNGRRTRRVMLRIVAIAGRIEFAVLAERGHLKFAELFPGPIKMLVFFLLDGFRRGCEHFAKAVVGGLPGDLAEQFPVGVILGFREHDILHRVQLILVAGESRIARGPQQSLGLLGGDFSGVALRTRVAAQLADDLGQNFLMSHRLLQEFA